MECIKEKCKYCEEDDFHHSCFRCHLSQLLFKRDLCTDCKIEKEIASVARYLDNLKRYKQYIADNQKHS